MLFNLSDWASIASLISNNVDILCNFVRHNFIIIYFVYLKLL